MLEVLLWCFFCWIIISLSVNLVVLVVVFVVCIFCDDWVVMLEMDYNVDNLWG